MKKIVLLLAIIFCSSCASKRVYVCGGQISDISRLSLVRLRVLSVYDTAISYEISQSLPRTLTITKFRSENCEYWSHVVYQKSHTLLESEYENIIMLLNKALETPPIEKHVGLDGEEWMLESSVYNYTAIIYWSPGVESEKRGLEGVVNLKSYFSKFEN